MKKLLLATLLSCLSFANPAKASVTVIVGAVALTVGDQGDMGPPGGIDIDIPAAQAYGISYSEPQNFFSFYWASTGPNGFVSFTGPGNGGNAVFQANGCDLAGNCGNPIDRYITFDLTNAGGATGVFFRAPSELNDFYVLNFSAGVPEPSTWATMLIGFAGRLHGLSQDEGERGGVVNRGARDERSSAIRRLQARIARSTGLPIRRAPGWACGRRPGDFLERAACGLPKTKPDYVAVHC